jgi:PKD repeat protein
MLTTLLVVLIPGDVESNGKNTAPDLHVVTLYNYTEVITGEPSWFNLTVHNQGDAAFLVRTHGSLEIYAYRDNETQVAAFERVYEDIFINQSLVIDFKVQFDVLGPHTLTVVIDGADKVWESDEENNVEVTSFEVVSASSNRPPKADGGNDRLGYSGKALLFSAKYSSDPDNDQLTFDWDFGDGNTGSGQRLYHTYQELGEYGVVLTVSDGLATDTDAFTIHIIEAPKNKAPLAIILSSSKKVLVNEHVTLDGSSSADADGDDLSFTWTIDTEIGAKDKVLGDVIVRSWDSPGYYDVVLEVSDGTDEATYKVTIEVGSPPPPNEPPVANAGVDLIIDQGTTWIFYGAGLDADGNITSYEWDLDGDGVYDTYDEVDGSIEHKFKDPGYVTVKLRVTDDRGGSHVDSIVVTVKDTGKGDKATPGFPAFAVITMILGAALLARRSRIR